MIPHKRKRRGGYGGPQRREFVVNQIAIANRSATLSRSAGVVKTRFAASHIAGAAHGITRG